MPPGVVGKIRTLFGGHEPGSGKERIPRNDRYVLHGSILYRPAGGMDWYKGTTENLSATGVLFLGEIPIPINTPIEMTITPPKGPERRTPEGIFCWGTVVRTASTKETQAKPVLAAKIQKYRTPPKWLTDADIHFTRMA